MRIHPLPRRDYWRDESKVIVDITEDRGVFGLQWKTAMPSSAVDKAEYVTYTAEACVPVNLEQQGNAKLPLEDGRLHF